MAMKRTTVFVDEGDLATLKDAAARRGVAEAELLRDAIHLAAMANQRWSDPFFGRTFTPPESTAGGRDAEDALWAAKAEAYERTKGIRS